MEHESKIAPRIGVPLGSIVLSVEKLQAVKKADLCAGDCVIVKTVNSAYTIRVEGGNKYLVSGGWFGKKGRTPATTTIAGCTWGGSAIKVDIIAACGLSLEFGNRLITSTIQKIFVLPRGCHN
jgi:hypothetical protein